MIGKPVSPEEDIDRYSPHVQVMIREALAKQYPTGDAPGCTYSPDKAKVNAIPLPKPEKPPVWKMSEQELQDSIIELAPRLGWMVAHFRPGMTSRTYTNKKGKTKNVWVTPVGADGSGFPDLVLSKPGRLIFAECKSDTGILSAEQIKWGNSLAGPVQWDYYIWRPADWQSGLIERMLKLGIDNKPRLVVRYGMGIDLERLAQKIRRLERHQLLYKVLKRELSILGYWRNRPRGDPAKGFREKGKNEKRPK